MTPSVLSVLGSLVVSSMLPGQSAEIARLMQGYADYRAYNGAVLVADEGEVVYQQAFGLANREWGIANQVDTRFFIASVTKPFTAALTLRLVQVGDLSLDDTVCDLLPYYRQDTGTRITIHHLLSHTSGLPNYSGTREFWEGNPGRLDYDQREVVEKFCSGDLMFEPGSNARYSDANYFLLALISAAAAGKPFAEALDEHVLEPIGAKDSGAIRQGQIIERRAYGYLRRGRAYTLPAPINYEDIQLGAGDMFSTVGDMFRFDQALHDGFLDDTLTAAMFTGHANSGFPGQRNGYGWNIASIALRGSGERVRVEQAPGNNAGFSSVIYRIPERRAVVILALNAGPSYLDMQMFEICVEVAHLLHGEPARMLPHGLADTLGRVVRDEGHEAARRAYDEFQASGGDLDVRRVNALGYELLAEDRVDDAVLVFELNVRSAPRDGNVYDSLGEALARRGDVAGAISNYKKSLELDPRNANARRWLERLGGGR